MGKYRKQRAPRKLKWTNIPNDDVASKPMESYWEKGRPVAKPIASKKENDLKQIGKIREK